MNLDPRQFGHIGVLMGGYSSEREISLKSGTAVYESLHKSGCEVSALDINMQDDEGIYSFIEKTRIKVAFIALHGRLGEDGTIQKILERAQIPYTGSGPKASQMAINKSFAQKLFQKNQIPIPRHILISKNEKLNFDDILAELKGPPVVIKPNCEGSSIGITMVTKPEQFEKALQSAFQYGQDALIEEYIMGKELTVGIFDDAPLPAIEIRSKDQFFNFNAKYLAGTTEYLIPAEIPKAVEDELGHLALKAHESLGCRNFSRVDFILDKQMNPFVLEINTIPGFTSKSLLPKAAQSAGIDFSQLCLRLVKMANEKKIEIK